jgi:hypothetical protein
MSTFVHGMIVEQEGAYGYYYEMKLRVPTGHVLPLNYDNDYDTSKASNEEEEETANDPMSDLLEVGGTYELLTVMQVRHLTFQPSVPPGTIFKVETNVIERAGSIIKFDEVRQGKVLDPSWNVASQEYLAISLHATIYQKRYVLLETAIGKLLVNYRDIQSELGEQGKQVTVGSYLQWQNAELILLAIIEKHAPKPEV